MKVRGLLFSPRLAYVFTVILAILVNCITVKSFPGVLVYCNMMATNIYMSFIYINVLYRGEC